VEAQHVTELIPAYVLGCLDTSDAELVERHLATCPVCQAEVESYRPIAAQIALAGPLATPPPELRTRLMARIAPAPTAQPTPRMPARLTWSQRLAAFTQRIAPVWTPVSLLLIVALLASNLLLWRTSARAPAAVDLVTVQMTGTEEAPGARGVLSAPTAGQSGVLVVQGLPPLDPAQQYQLWLVQDGQRTNGGVFSVDDAGFGQLRIEAPQPLTAYGAFGVTIEPAGGSPGPTGARVLGGQL
jgi:anti-sigma-K factor RskA